MASERERTHHHRRTDPLATDGPQKETATVQSAAALLVIANVNAQGLGEKEYVDPATYHLVRDEWTDRSGTTTTTYDDYQLFGSQTLPAHWTDSDAAGSTAYTRVERVAGAATAADVTMPGIRRLLVEFPGTAPVQIPAKFYHGRVYVQATIAGHAVDLLLDSGSDGIAIDATAAKQAGLTLINRRVNANNARAFDQSDVVVPELKIGSLTMRNIVATTAALPTADDPGVKLAGLLGSISWPRSASRSITSVNALR